MAQKELITNYRKTYNFVLILFIVLGLGIMYSAYVSIKTGSELFVTIILLIISVSTIIIGFLVYISGKNTYRWWLHTASLFKSACVLDDKLKLPEKVLITPALFIYERSFRGQYYLFRRKVEKLGNEILSDIIECSGIENFSFIDSMNAIRLVIPGWIITDPKYTYRKHRLFISCIKPYHFMEVKKSSLVEYKGAVARYSYDISHNKITGTLEAISLEGYNSVQMFLSTTFQVCRAEYNASILLAEADENNRLIRFEEDLFPPVNEPLFLAFDTEDRQIFSFRFLKILGKEIGKNVIWGFNRIRIEIKFKGKLLSKKAHEEEITLKPHLS